MEGILTPFTPRDFLRSKTRDLMAAVSAIWDREVGPESDPFRRDDVILVELGDWLKQDAWVDKTGFYLKIRPHPLTSEAKRTEKMARVRQAFLDLFENKKGLLEEEVGGVQILVVHLATHSIGD
jgi:hypothetical protein